MAEFSFKGASVDIQKLKVKVGEHEFEAEGPPDVVREQFDAFRELLALCVANSPAAPQSPQQPLPAGPTQSTTLMTGVRDEVPAGDNLRLDKITRVDGRLVSLTVRGANVEDEVLLVLYGQKLHRNNDSVTGGEIINGLRQTGRALKRVDYYLDKLTSAGDAITVGVGRARRYRLTNQGMTKARDIAKSLADTVA